MESHKAAKALTSNSETTLKQPVFRLYFEFLRMSPSYELARISSNGELSKLQKKLLPFDFDVVLKTFTQVGDVRETTFKKWWRNRGLDLFAPTPTSLVRLISDGSSTKNKTADTSAIRNPKSPEIMIAVPTSLKYSEAVAQVCDLLASHKNTFNQSKPLKNSASGIQILSDRIHEEKLMKGLYLVQLKAEFPDIEIWQLGTQARISEDYANELRPVKNLKRSMEGLEYDKGIMTKLTSRALKNYEAIIENSARGLFPSTKKLSHKFNYDLLRELLMHYEG